MTELNEFADTSRSGSSVGVIEILQADDMSPATDGFADVLGDRLLLAGNQIVRIIRRLCSSMGFCYSVEPTPNWRHYVSMPLLCLQEIFDTRLIPFKDNAQTVRDLLENRSFQADDASRALLTFVDSNYLMHESAHCIAYHSLGGYTLSIERPQNRMQIVSLHVLAEAYANTVETIGSAFSTDPVSQVAYSLNSHRPYRRELAVVAAETITVLGLYKVLLLGILTFYYRNTHVDHISDEIILMLTDLVLEDSRRRETDALLCQLMITAVFELSAKFTLITTPLFFDYLGILSEFHKLCAGSFSRGVLDDLHVISNSKLLADLTFSRCADHPVQRALTDDNSILRSSFAL